MAVMGYLIERDEWQYKVNHGYAVEIDKQELEASQKRIAELEADCARIASENACNQIEVHNLKAERDQLAASLETARKALELFYRTQYGHITGCICKGRESCVWCVYSKAMQNPSTAQEERDREEWHIEGCCLYSLMHAGWRKGVEQFTNRVSVNFKANFDRDVPAEERERFNGRLLKMIRREFGLEE